MDPNDRGNPTLTVNADGTITGHDPGYGIEHECRVTLRRNPDGTITVIEAESRPVTPRPASPSADQEK